MYIYYRYVVIKILINKNELKAAQVEEGLRVSISRNARDCGGASRNPSFKL